MENKQDKTDIGVVSIVNKDEKESVQIDMLLDPSLFTPQEISIMNDVCAIIQNILITVVQRQEKENN